MVTLILLLAASGGFSETGIDEGTRAVRQRPAAAAAATPRPRLQLDLSDLLDEEAAETGTAPRPAVARHTPSAQRPALAQRTASAQRPASAQRSARLDPWVASMISNVRFESPTQSRRATSTLAVSRQPVSRQTASREPTPRQGRPSARDYPPGRW